MASNASADPHHHSVVLTPAPAEEPAAGHISGVQTSLRQAAAAATELGDLLAGALAADDQQRHAESNAAPQAQRADDSDVR